MIKGHQIRCILFDLGSTLWTTVDKATWLRLEQASNLIAVKALLHFTNDKEFSLMESHTLGALIRKAVEKRIRFEARQNPGYEPDFILATMEALQQVGISKANRALGEDIYEALRIRIPNSRALFDDTLSTLAVLKQRGYSLGVVTNRHYGGAPFHEDLQTIGLLDYFEYEPMAISADLGIRKPNPDIFLHALNMLNVPPEEAAMVGDSLKADIVGARMLDILAIWKPKASLREEAKVAWMSSYLASREHQTHSSVAKIGGEMSDAEIPEASEGASTAGFTEDHLLAYVHNRDGLKLQQIQIEIKPDIIIENLRDLLEIF
ncbi:MAG TPA: HAD family hydrolase [Ktedonobacteraceae bacterium]